MVPAASGGQDADLTGVRADGLNVNNRLRQFWFRHYWWLTCVLLAVAVLSLVLNGTSNSLGFIVPSAAAALSVIYFVQKQKLEELQVFEKLFTQFNARY